MVALGLLTTKVPRLVLGLLTTKVPRLGVVRQAVIRLAVVCLGLAVALRLGLVAVALCLGLVAVALCLGLVVAVASSPFRVRRWVAVVVLEVAGAGDVG